MTSQDFCQNCPLNKSCLWTGLGFADHDRLINIIKLQSALHRGHQLFRMGESLRSLYVLRSGSIKTWNVTRDGEDHIIRFHLPGDVLGLGSISSGVYDCNATTLDTCSICEIPFNQFQKLAEEIPILNRLLLKLMSREIALEEHRVLLRGNRSAPAKLAAFLSCLSKKFGDRGFSTQEFNLTMGRREIANYLGLALETVSRTLTQFQQEGVLSVEGKHIRVTDRVRLSELSGLQSAPDIRGQTKALCH